jgi:sugar lactone lactonase YvrE
MFEGMSGSAYQEVLTQYFDPTGRVSATVSVNSYIDTHISAPTNVTFSSFEPELDYVLEQNPTWKREPNAQFAVLPAPGTTYAEGFSGFCAYHDIDSHRGVFLVVPYAGDAPFSTDNGCQAYYGGGDAMKATSLMASHEYTEAATDPFWDTEPAWLNSEGYENADLCSTPYDELPNGTFVQGTYDDHQSACSISDKNPPHVLGLTDHPTDVTPHGATLNATINPESLATSYHFEYGPTTAYGTTLSSVSAGAGRANVQVQAAISGLAPEQTYHYRVAAENSTGVTYGEDQIVVTSRWIVRPLPEPTRTGPSWLNSVSCASEHFCAAVGHYYNASEGGNRGLAYVGAGNEWTWYPVSGGSGGQEMSGIDCTSDTSCILVGSNYESEGGVAMAARWDGSTWIPQSVPKLAGTYWAGLGGVSCPTSTECIAVGMKQDNTGVYSVYSARYSNGSWTNLETPVPTGATQSQFNRVYCRSMSFCVAVGWGNILGTKKIIMKWNGSSWSIQTPQEEWGVGNGIACPGEQFCVESGGWLGWAAPLEHWNGSQWKVASLAPDPDGNDGWLSEVSCVSTSACTVVGSSHSKKNGAPFPLVETWNGSEWALQRAPRESEVARNDFIGVDCVSKYSCVGVGLSAVSGAQEPYIATEEPLNPPLATTNGATAVAATSATLGATVDANGLATTYQFEYGKTTSYGSKAPASPSSAGSGTDPVAVSQAIEGLQPHKLYHFRIVAENSEGVAYGKDETFFTAPAYITAFGSYGSGNSQFSSPFGISADSSGNVYIADYGNNRIEEFNSKGEYLSQFGSLGSGNGQFKGPGDVAVAANGDLLVTDGGNARVEKFNSKGEYQSQFGSYGTGNGQFITPSGVTVAPNGHIWVSDWSNPRVEEFSATGQFIQSVAGGWPSGIAADQQGNIWVANFGNNNKLGKIDPAKGAYVAEFGSYGSGNGQFEGLQAVEVLPSGNILATDRYSGRVQELTPTGEYVTQFGGGGFVQEPNGLAAGPGGAIYVSNTRNHQIKKWCIPGAPSANTQSASSVESASATLKASVNPTCLATTYQFEYGKTTSYGSKAPASPSSAGSGTDPVAVSQAISGLQASTTYHFRIVAENSEGVAYGKDETFTTIAGTAAQLTALAVTEPFNGSAGSLANFSANWTALGWAAGSPAKGADTASGWGPVSAYPTINGAFYSGTVTDGGSGGAVVATMAVSPGNASRYFSLWFDMGTPSGTKAGYELRLTYVSASAYSVSLSRWQGGTQNTLTSLSSYSLSAGNSLALVDQGGTVSAWTNKGSGFSQVLSANDSTFSSGKTGVEGAGNITRLTNFKAGSL